MLTVNPILSDLSTACADITFGSCFLHAIAITESKFLMKLSLAIKKRKTPAPPEDAPAPSTSTGEVLVPEIDDEDTKEEIVALTQEVNTIIAELPERSDQAKLLASLLLKLHGFVAKVNLKLDCHISLTNINLFLGSQIASGQKIL
jgi:hypothetical protein